MGIRVGQYLDQSYLFEELQPYDAQILKDEYDNWLKKKLEEGEKDMEKGRFCSLEEFRQKRMKKKRGDKGVDQKGRLMSGMQKVIFVMGATAAGKTHFIETHYADKDVDILNVYDYQQRAYEEAGFKEAVPFEAEFRCLMNANNMLLEDIIEKLRQGRNVVVEQTFYKAKRRIAYIDEIRKAANAMIEIYVMCPSDALWKSNLEKREMGGSFERYKEQVVNVIEFPNPAEGIDRIYEVVDGEIRLRMEPPKPEILDKAREELAEEAGRIRCEDEAINKRKELLESMKTRPFWHYCEVCGKKEFITAQDAFDSGWDYPPHMGHFGLLGPRTCGGCLLTDTLFWRVNTDKKIPLPVVVEGALTPEELITWKRIKGEPESLLDAEVEGESDESST